MCSGVWNVAFISVAVLMSGQWLAGLQRDSPSWWSKELDADMAFCEWMRERVSTAVCVCVCVCRGSGCNIIIIL